MSKEALVFVLDVGPSMWQTKDKSGLTRLDKAIKALSLMVQQKIIDNRKTDAVALVLFGCDVTKNSLHGSEREYEGVVVEREFAPAELSLIKYLQEETCIGNRQGDCLDALVVGADLLINFCGTKKYEKKIYIFTDADSPINTEGLSEIIEQIKQSEAVIDIIGMDFELDANEKRELKVSNEKLLGEIAEKLDGSVFAISEALGILSHFMKKRVRTSTAFRGNLEIAGENLAISIQSWPKTSESKLPSAKKLSKVSKESLAKETMDVKRSISYFTLQEDAEVIEPESLVKAYKYGKSLIPFHKVDEIQLGFFEERSMKLIGFIPADQIDRSSFMNNVFCVSSDPASATANKMLSSFIHGMYEKEVYGLVRYVRVKNANPKLGVLIPHIKASYECFYFAILPFAEDVRRYTFSSFTSTKDSHMDCMEAWINSMDLMKGALDEEGNPMEAYKPKDCFNPAYQRLYQCIIARLSTPEAAIPEIDPQLIKHIEPIPSLYKRSADCFEQVQKYFKLEKVERARDVKRVWGAADQSDLDKLLGLEDGVKKSCMDASVEEEEFSIKKLVDKGVEHVGSVNPVEDFNALIARKDADFVSRAIDEICSLIITCVIESIGDLLFSKAIDCLVALRKGCVAEDEPDKFNDFMRDLKKRFSTSKRHSAFWNMVSDKITLISQADCSSSTLNEEQAQEFKETTVAPSMTEDLADMLD